MTLLLLLLLLDTTQDNDAGYRAVLINACTR